MLNIKLVVDRSGSMGNRWNETIGSLNGYVEALQEQKTEGKISVVMFDDVEPYKVVRNNESIAYFTKLNETEYAPRGMTPLYDAFGKAIAQAEEENAERTIIVVMTDGHENASREFNQEAAKAAVERVTKLGWEVIFLGANFDASRYSQAMGLDSTKFANTSDGNMGARMRSMALKTSGYATGQSINYTAEEQAELN